MAQISGGIGRALASVSFDEDYRKVRKGLWQIGGRVIMCVILHQFIE